ncbi:hypothetical protein [Catenulispora rubra]|uniref:hypothetical protein n=1 Tax=Catenulispora rubra TaxID=280293 RepID=UPI001892518C|nr:hypothetical protein [Catenulispora rubra]
MENDLTGRENLVLIGRLLTMRRDQGGMRATDGRERLTVPAENNAAFGRVAEEISGSGITAAELAPRLPGLDEVFLTLTTRNPSDAARCGVVIDWGRRHQWRPHGPISAANVRLPSLVTPSSPTQGAAMSAPRMPAIRQCRGRVCTRRTHTLPGILPAKEAAVAENRCAVRNAVMHALARGRVIV